MNIGLVLLRPSFQLIIPFVMTWRWLSVSVEEEDREASGRDKVQGRRPDRPRDARPVREREVDG